jgi:hypothetical protein
MVVNIRSKKELENQYEEFMRMCAWMELCGNIGHSVDFRVYYDGDGRAHLNFSFMGSDQSKYERIKKELLEAYNKQHSEPKEFMFD